MVLLCQPGIAQKYQKRNTWNKTAQKKKREEKKKKRKETE